jgi:hypothetical protein
MAAKTAAQKSAEAQTSPTDDAQTGSEPKVEIDGTEMWRRVRTTCTPPA